MKIVKVAIVFALSALLLAITTVPASADKYTVGDGSLQDWGVDWGASQYMANTPAVSVLENYWLGPYYPGTKSTMDSGYGPGIEECDIEAMYLDEDENGPYIYIAIITSMHPDGITYYCPQIGKEIKLIPGDLRLEIDGVEYGVKLTNEAGFVGSWAGKSYDVVNEPRGTIFKEITSWALICPSPCAQQRVPVSNIVSGTKCSGTATISYQIYGDWNEDRRKPNYLIEMKIPKSALGISAGKKVDVVATQSCANDVITIRGFECTDIPEFATIAIPVVAILGLFLFFNNRKRREN